MAVLISCYECIRLHDLIWCWYRIDRKCQRRKQEKNLFANWGLLQHNHEIKFMILYTIFHPPKVRNKNQNRNCDEQILFAIKYEKKKRIVCVCMWCGLFSFHRVFSLLPSLSIHTDFSSSMPLCTQHKLP